MNIEEYQPYHDNDQCLVLVPLAKVPDGATVLKRSGPYEHSVSRTITFYNGGEKQTLKAKDRCAFLAPKDHQTSTYNAYPPDTLVLWVLSRHDLILELEDCW